MKPIKVLYAEDYDEIFQLSEFAFQYKLSPEELQKKKEEASRHTIWGWMDDNAKIAAKVHLIPLTCYLNEKPFAMGGISAVATWPEYRRQGMVKHLLHHALQYMRKNGQMISYLHPFSVPFYRKFGWELCFMERKCTIPMEGMRQNWEGRGYVRRISTDIPLLHAIYTGYAKKYNGMMTRDEKWWQQRILRQDFHIAAAYNDSNQPEGYIIYHVQKDKLEIVDFAYTSMNGWKLLLQFIANHDSMAAQVELTVPENEPLSLLLEKPVLEQKIQSYFMARIVDIPAFLKEYSFAKGSHAVQLVVADEFLPENSGSYVIEKRDTDTYVNFTKEGHITAEDIHMKVQQLTQILFGFARPMELHRLGLIQGSEASVRELEWLIPERQTYFADFF
ncbi:GNAT family N-acetyltransferase [Virgibacillus halophilus]|uniref:GNAT family N-acetyltransferase n=1 Tax=Tigheibacillus halophilus TaxID=361280 RepID=UPI0036F1B9C6